MGRTPPRPEKIEQMRSQARTCVIQPSPNTAAGGFRALLRCASLPDDRRAAQGLLGRERSPLKPSGWDGGTAKSAPKRPKDVHAWREPLCIQRRKKALVERTSRTARPTRTRPTTHAAGREERRHDRRRSEPKGAELTLLPRAQRGARLSGRGGEIERIDAGDVWAR